MVFRLTHHPQNSWCIDLHVHIVSYKIVKICFKKSNQNVANTKEDHT